MYGTVGRKCPLAKSTAIPDGSYPCNPTSMDLTINTPPSTECDCDEPSNCEFDWTMVVEGVTCPNVIVYLGLSAGTQNGNDWTFTGTSSVNCNPANDGSTTANFFVKEGSTVKGKGTGTLICKKCA